MFQDAMTKEEWYNAMEEELTNSIRMRCDNWWIFSKARLQLGMVIRTKFHVDGNKVTCNGSIQKNKVCLIAKGYSQREIADYEDTSSHITWFETVRTLLTLITHLN